jgi:hypothetical protein
VNCLPKRAITELSVMARHFAKEPFNVTRRGFLR